MAKQKIKQENENKYESKSLRLASRGRIFEGTVTKKFPTRVVIEFERMIFVPKYERFYKKKTRIHARLPEGMQIALGDYIKVQECRPLSKIIHHVVMEKVRSADKKDSHESGDKK